MEEVLIFIEPVVSPHCFSPSFASVSTNVSVRQVDGLPIATKAYSPKIKKPVYEIGFPFGFAVRPMILCYG